MKRLEMKCHKCPGMRDIFSVSRDSGIASISSSIQVVASDSNNGGVIRKLAVDIDV